MTNEQTQSVKNSKNTKDKPKNVRLTKVDLAFFFFLGKIDVGEPASKCKGGMLCLQRWRTSDICTNQSQKGGVAMITLKDIHGIFNQLRKILAMLDKIYHAMGLDKEE